MENNKTLLTFFVLFVVVAIVGFYLAFDKISTLTTTVSNLELQQHISGATSDTPIATTTTIIEQAPTSTVQNPTDNPTVITAAIMFEMLSGEALKPQATTTISIDSVIKHSDGTIEIVLKANTRNATGYTALDPKQFIALLTSSGDTDQAGNVTGQFSSMPPKSSVSGSIIFKPSENRNSYVIQVGTGDDTKFYEFDFQKKTYKETVIG